MIAEWPGYCPTCEAITSHVQYGEWLRDELVCRLCASNPRLRAIMWVLSSMRPGWRQERIWEVAPVGPMSDRLRTQCIDYTASHFWPDVAPGESRDGFRCEDIQAPTFDDRSFDIVIASDVLEHVFDPHRALAQIARVLADDGVFVWTVPQIGDLPTSRPRVRHEDGTIEHLLPPEYHGDPVNEDGVLVTFDWGRDLPGLVEEASGLTTSVYTIESRVLGILGAHPEVFVSCASVEGWAAGVRRERARVDAEQQRITQLSALRAENDDLVRQLVETTKQRDDLEGQLIESGRHVDHLLVQQRDAASQIAALQASTSWRVTRPLRAASGILRRRS